MGTRSNVVSPKSATPKTTLMDRRVKKQANKTGKTSSMPYSGGKH
jgi:hypothetical protein